MLKCPLPDSPVTGHISSTPLLPAAESELIAPPSFSPLCFQHCCLEKDVVHMASTL